MLDHFHIVLAVGAFILDSRKRLLLVKKSPNEKIDAGRWVVPGGKIEQGEFIFDGLKREVAEEVGLVVTSYNWINENVFVSNSYHFHAEHFICKVKSTNKVVLEKNLTEYVYADKKDIPKYDIPSGILETINKIYG